MRERAASGICADRGRCDASLRVRPRDRPNVTRRTYFRFPHGAPGKLCATGRRALQNRITFVAPVTDKHHKLRIIIREGPFHDSRFAPLNQQVPSAHDARWAVAGRVEPGHGTSRCETLFVKAASTRRQAEQIIGGAGLVLQPADPHRRKNGCSLVANISPRTPVSPLRHR